MRKKASKITNGDLKVKTTQAARVSQTAKVLQAKGVNTAAGIKAAAKTLFTILLIISANYNYERSKNSYAICIAKDLNYLYILYKAKE